MNSKLIVLAALAAGIMAVGCTVHDPSYDDVVVPVVELKSITLTGVVSDKEGNPLSGATIEVGGKTVVTNADGIYIVTLDASGDYTVTASATGKYARSADLTVELSEVAQTVVQNFVLSSVVTVVFSSEENAEEDTQYIEQNDPAVVTITGTVTTETEEGAQFAIDIFYDESEIPSSKAVASKASVTEEMVLFGFNFRQISGTPGATATFTVSINKDVQDNVKVKKLNEATGTWMPVVFESSDGFITIHNAEVGYFAVFCDITKEEIARTAAVSIDPSNVDNLYGGIPKTVSQISYSYYTGVDIDPAQAKKEDDQMKALLLEKLAYDYGVSEAKKVDITQNVSFTVPVGTAVSFHGSQVLYDIVYSKGAKKAVGTVYGDVTVGYTSYNRRHDGGSN